MGKWWTSTFASQFQPPPFRAFRNFFRARKSPPPQVRRCPYAYVIHSTNIDMIQMPFFDHCSMTFFSDDEDESSRRVNIVRRRQNAPVFFTWQWTDWCGGLPFQSRINWGENNLRTLANSAIIKKPLTLSQMSWDVMFWELKGLCLRTGDDLNTESLSNAEDEFSLLILIHFF